jgi:hypothetical protein
VVDGQFVDAVRRGRCVLGVLGNRNGFGRPVDGGTRRDDDAGVGSTGAVQNLDGAPTFADWLATGRSVDSVTLTSPAW